MVVEEERTAIHGGLQTDLYSISVEAEALLHTTIGQQQCPHMNPHSKVQQYKKYNIQRRGHPRPGLFPSSLGLPHMCPWHLENDNPLGNSVVVVDWLLRAVLVEEHHWLIQPYRWGSTPGLPEWGVHRFDPSTEARQHWYIHTPSWHLSSNTRLHRSLRFSY